jgi:hypothetical protein
MMSLGELQISFPLFFFTKNSTNDIISGNFDSEKVDQDEVFYYKDTFHFISFQNDPNITHTKNYIFGLVAL